MTNKKLLIEKIENLDNEKLAVFLQTEFLPYLRYQFHSELTEWFDRICIDNDRFSPDILRG